MFKLMGKKIIKFYANKISLSGSMFKMQVYYLQPSFSNPSPAESIYKVENLVT